MRPGRPLFAPTPRRVRRDILAVGQCSLDRVARVDALPRPGGKLRLDELLELPGGQVATAARALARLGLRVGLVTTVGDDGLGERALAPVREEGVELLGVRRVEGAPSQTALVLVDRARGERVVLWHRDARLALSERDLCREDLVSCRLLHLDAGDPELAAWAAGVARAAGAAVVLDADAWSPALEPLLAEVDFPIVSHELAQALGGPEATLDALAARGARLPVVTLGAAGCLAGPPGARLACSAFPVEARDTTGAGDLFHAGFGWALLRGLGPEEALRAASAAAAFGCRALGAQGALPGEDELRALLREPSEIAVVRRP